MTEPSKAGWTVWGLKVTKRKTKNARTVDIYVGGHGNYGDDGYPMASDRSIGRTDYLTPQCNIRDEYWSKSNKARQLIKCFRDPEIARRNRRDGRGCATPYAMNRRLNVKVPGVDQVYLKAFKFELTLTNAHTY